MPEPFNGRKHSIFSNVETTGYPHAKRINLYLYFIPHSKIYSRSIKDLSVRAGTVKLLEENISVNFQDFQIFKATVS